WSRRRRLFWRSWSVNAARSGIEFVRSITTISLSTKQNQCPCLSGPETSVWRWLGFVRRNAYGVWAMLESGHEQPVPVFQQLAGSDPSGRDDVRAVPAVAAQCRGSAGRARDRYQP